MNDVTKYFTMAVIAIVIGSGAYVLIRKEGINAAADKVLGKDYDQATVDAAMTGKYDTTKQVYTGDDEKDSIEGGSRKRRRMNSKKRSNKRSKRRRNSTQISKKKK